MDPNNQASNPQSPEQPQPNPQQPYQAPDPHAPQPVAYDQYGRPLYAHPPANPAPLPQQAPQQQVVHVARPINPEDVHIPEEIQRRHEESRKKYPHLNLSRGEFVIRAIKRHPIGIFKIWAIAIVLILAFGVTAFFLFLGEKPAVESTSNDTGQLAALGTALIIIPAVLVSLGAMVATYVYRSNRFYLTNESVVQEIMNSLFATHEQTVSLANIEDASYKQTGIIPMLFNYGEIRLSTEGDETTYHFTYVTAPKKHIAVLNNAVEAFKNGRPVVFDESD